MADCNKFTSTGYSASTATPNITSNITNHNSKNNNTQNAYHTSGYNSHYSKPSFDATANIQIESSSRNNGGFQHSLNQSPLPAPSALHANLSLQPPPHPLMSLPPPVTTAMNSQVKQPLRAPIGNNGFYNKQGSCSNNTGGGHEEHNSFPSRTTPHFQMFDHSTNHNLVGDNFHHDQQYSVSSGGEAAFDHVPQSHINGYPLSHPKPTLPLPESHQQQQQQQPQQQQSQQYPSRSSSEDLQKKYNVSSANDRFDSSSYHMGQPSNSNSQFVRQFSHHLNENHSVNLKFIKNLNTMMENWTEEEIKASRRLVKFDISQGQNNGNNNNTVQVINFQPLQPNDYEVTQAVVSCIYWREKNKFICTSVDIILLLEYFVHQSFGIEEKNRIRRNLQSLKPTTVSRSNKNDREFFSLIMGMENPRPRNIEKDLKVFNWSDLGKAIAKVMSKYYIVSSPSPGSRNLWCNGGPQSYNVPLSGSSQESSESPSAPAPASAPVQARQGDVTAYSNSIPYHGSPPPAAAPLSSTQKPGLPPLASVASASDSLIPPSQLPPRQPSSYSEGGNTSSLYRDYSTPNSQSITYQGDAFRRTVFHSPLNAQISGTSLDSSNVCSDVTPTYHPKESNQQYHHRYHSPSTGIIPLPLPPPKIHPSNTIPSHSQRTWSGGGVFLPSLQPRQQHPISSLSQQASPPSPISNSRSIAQLRNNHTPVRGMNSAPSIFASNEESSLSSSDNEKHQNRLSTNSTALAISSSGENPPTTNLSDSPSPGKENEEVDTGSGSERSSSGNDGDEVGSSLSGDSKTSGGHSDGSGRSSKSNGESNSASSISSGTKDSSSLFSLPRDSGNSSQESSRPNSLPGSGKFAPLSFNYNNSSVSLLGTSNDSGDPVSNLPRNKSNLRSLIDFEQPSPILEHKVEEGGETDGDEGVQDEDESMEDEEDYNKQHHNNSNLLGADSSPPVSKKRKRRFQKKGRGETTHQVQNNATSHYFDNNSDKKYMPKQQPTATNDDGATTSKPQLPPISQILKAELYSSDNKSTPGSPMSPSTSHHLHQNQSPPPPPATVATHNEPLIRKVQSWDDH
ncbi:hypothetical protein KGF57_004419 [Candida theae]|uniref:DUF7082 domain-containing protein n=1 Tax=Candida theae TaxID=1198502 RepID=A0AAD5BBP7_9ASCO|nr:uncharacterized protein KGF57_004419 [Candida theae]KAI5950074.1 hypothetical protein KGF57_004419 [Candida theae]